MAGFYLDNDVAQRLAIDLEALGHVATHAHFRQLDRVPDFVHLLEAATNNLTLVTHNAKDYRLLHGAWTMWPRHFGTEWTHAGILIIPQARWSTQECAQEIDQLFRETSSFDNQIRRWTPSNGWISWA